MRDDHKNMINKYVNDMARLFLPLTHLRDLPVISGLRQALEGRVPLAEGRQIQEGSAAGTVHAGAHSRRCRSGRALVLVLLRALVLVRTLAQGPHGCEVLGGSAGVAKPG